MLKATNIKKSFGDNTVLKGISLEVEKGDVVTILGPSGSGKTTFLRCINFLESADEGELTLDGIRYDIKRIHNKDILRYRRKTGFVFQGYNLFANKTALENITAGLTIVRKISKSDAINIAKEALEWVGLPDKANFYPSELSGGQQQRVSIARAIATEPNVIFFDEPTSALDPELTGEVLGVMKKLADDGTTMVIVTHELSFAQGVSDKVLFMEKGEVIEQGEAKRFFASPDTERAAQFLKISSSDYDFAI